jgi:hypothetical protein
MTATKIQPGDDLHLTSLMAPHSLNFVTGADRAALLAYGRDVFAAGLAGAAPAAVAGPADDLAELAMLNKLVELGTQAYGALAKSNSDDGPAGTAAYVRWQERRAEMGELIRAHKAPALEAPPAVAPQGEYPHEQMDAMALDRYKVVPSNASMLWSHAVVAGDGTQQLYVGREVECQNMARKFAGAFLDGAFAFHSTAAAPTAPAAPALEAPSAYNSAGPIKRYMLDCNIDGMDQFREFILATDHDTLVHDVLANADPAGTVQENGLLRDQVRQLDAMVGRMKREAVAPQAPAAPADAQAFAEWWDRERGTARNRLPGDDWMDLSNEDREQYEAAFNAGMRAAKAAPAAPAVDAVDADGARYRYLRDEHIGDDPESINLPPGKKRGLDSAVDAAIAAQAAAKGEHDD